MRFFNTQALFAFLESRKALAACVLVAAILALLWGGKNNSSEDSAPAPVTVDTYIPLGFVLVPIEVQNYEALDSILGSHGYVDLFLPSKDGSSSKGIRVAHRVKILRAPNNASQFAVLVREDESERLVRSELPFFVVIQNTKSGGTGFVTGSPTKARKSSRVISEAE